MKDKGKVTDKARKTIKRIYPTIISCKSSSKSSRPVKMRIAICK